MSLPATEVRPLQITLGVDGRFDPGLVWLAGEAEENLFGASRPAGRVRALSLFRVGDWLLGAATVPVSAGLEEATRSVYTDILQASWGCHLARIWNYVPSINATGPGGLENYRAFCRGRALAYEQAHGTSFHAILPSASAVGTPAAALTVVFTACAGRPRHVENPLQVPAYEYPGEHGPRAPSFARATVVPGATQATVFISGTAAIRGHATVEAGSTPRQLDCTLENLRAISGACGLGPDLAAGRAGARHFKVYLRHASEQPAVAAVLAKRLLRESDHVSYLQADICRAALRVEIEASLFDVALPGGCPAKLLPPSP